MMRPTFLCILLLIGINLIQAQEISTAAQNVINEVKQLQMRDWESYKSQVKGSPYFFDQFKEATLLSNSKPPHNGEWVRYNIFNDQMELKKDGAYFSFNKDTTEYLRFNMGDSSFELIPIPFKKQAFSYAEIIALGKYSLYAKHLVIFKPAQNPKGYQDAIPPQYIRQVPLYYLKTSNGEFERIRNFKNLMELLPEQSSTINKFIKSNKLKFKKREDQKNLMDFINTSL